jgi:hypothetical protein
LKNKSRKTNTIHNRIRNAFIAGWKARQNRDNIVQDKWCPEEYIRSFKSYWKEYLNRIKK